MLSLMSTWTGGFGSLVWPMILMRRRGSQINTTSPISTSPPAKILTSQLCFCPRSRGKAYREEDTNDVQYIIFYCQLVTLHNYRIIIMFQVQSHNNKIVIHVHVIIDNTSFPSPWVTIRNFEQPFILCFEMCNI